MTIIETTINKGLGRAIAKGVVLVDFGAPWCGSCRSQEPIIEKLAEKFKGKVKIIILNMDNYIEVVTHFNISNVPTLIIFIDGEEYKRFVGVQPEEMLTETVNRALIKYDN